MRAQTLQVSWHGGEPVLSLDFSPSGLLATGGLDKTVRLWKLVVHPESPDTPPHARLRLRAQAPHHGHQRRPFLPRRVHSGLGGR